MAFYITRVRAKAFKNIGSEFREVSFAQGLNAVVGESRAARGACCWDCHLPAHLAALGTAPITSPLLQPLRLRPQWLREVQPAGGGALCLCRARHLLWRGPAGGAAELGEQ